MLVSGHTTQYMKNFDAVYKKLCGTRWDILVIICRCLHEELTTAKILVILNFSFAKGSSAEESFREINSALEDGIISL